VTELAVVGEDLQLVPPGEPGRVQGPDQPRQVDLSIARKLPVHPAPWGGGAVAYLHPYEPVAVTGDLGDDMVDVGDVPRIDQHVDVVRNGLVD